MSYPESCRVCLDNGASIPIFDVKDSPDPDVYFKLCQCLGGKVEDKDGLPRHICEPCLVKLNSAVEFIHQYKETEKLLQQCLDANLKTHDLLSHNNILLNLEEEYLDETIFDGLPNSLQIDAEGVANKIKVENVEYTITGVEDVENVEYTITGMEDVENVEYTITGVKDVEYVDENDTVCDLEVNNTVVGSVGECVIRIVSAPSAKENDSKKDSKKAKTLKKKKQQETKEVVDDKCKNFICSTCKETFQTYQKLKYHRTIEHNAREKCPICTKELPRAHLKNHIRVAHTPKPPVTFNCDLCGNKFGNKRDYSRHRKSEHGPGHKCPHCSQKFASIHSLPNHIRRCHKDTIPNSYNGPFVCETCGMTLDNRDKLNTHRLIHHSDKARYVPCPHCPKNVSAPGLKRHIKSSHGTNKNFACSFCGLRFIFQYQCARHEKMVHLDRINGCSPRYKCKFCDKTYACNAYMKGHIRSAHTGERPFVCDICKKDFARKCYLKEHMLQHTMVRPHKCPICGKGHTVVSNLKSHVRHNHRVSELDHATIEALSKSKINLLKHMRP